MKKLNLLLMALAACLLTFVSCEKDSELLVEKDAISTPQDLDSQGRSCSMETHMEKLLADPEYRNAHQRKLKRMSEMTITRSANCTNITTLPVAVHFQGVNNPDMDCLRQLAEIQVQVLNEDYQGTNPDIGLWNSNASSFPGVNNAEACLEFCIASQNHPAGFGLNDGDLAITFNSTSGDFVSQWSGYINIFVRANTGVLGYSPLGGSGNGDGVVVDASAFGKGLSCGGISPNAPYDLGRTLTHEMGHYLLLDHIWGGGCGSDDAVNDTPNSSSPYFGCPNVGASTCSSTDMHMNYMDYTNDACMYMFSDGQAGRMENYVLANLSNV
ncbi:MAG: M43 family zinc metalloprotease, partial [Saprospiraceae bacterium]